MRILPHGLYALLEEIVVAVPAQPSGWNDVIVESEDIWYWYYGLTSFYSGFWDHTIL
jgi:hypothetical protein